MYVQESCTKEAWIRVPESLRFHVERTGAKEHSAAQNGAEDGNIRRGYARASRGEAPILGHARASFPANRNGIVFVLLG